MDLRSKWVEFVDSDPARAVILWPGHLNGDALTVRANLVNNAAGFSGFAGDGVLNLSLHNPNLQSLTLIRLVGAGVGAPQGFLVLLALLINVPEQATLALFAMLSPAALAYWRWSLRRA